MGQVRDSLETDIKDEERERKETRTAPSKHFRFSLSLSLCQECFMHELLSKEPLLELFTQAVFQQSEVCKRTKREPFHEKEGFNDVEGKEMRRRTKPSEIRRDMQVSNF
jgi:hypothetical protein